jgi:hypothetical protein
MTPNAFIPDEAEGDLIIGGPGSRFLSGMTGRVSLRAPASRAGGELRRFFFGSNPWLHLALGALPRRHGLALRALLALGRRRLALAALRAAAAHLALAAFRALPFLPRVEQAGALAGAAAATRRGRARRPRSPARDRPGHSRAAGSPGPAAGGDQGLGAVLVELAAPRPVAARRQVQGRQLAGARREPGQEAAVERSTKSIRPVEPTVPGRRTSRQAPSSRHSRRPCRRSAAVQRRAVGPSIDQPPSSGPCRPWAARIEPLTRRS